MNTYWTEAAELYLITQISFFFEKSVSLKCDHHQAFEECLFVHVSIIIGLHCIMFLLN